jgi:hypothetical protein
MIDRFPPPLRKHLILLERAVGFEPMTYTLGRYHSTAELCPRTQERYL